MFVTEDMVGHKLGEFSPTRTFRGHGGKGRQVRLAVQLGDGSGVRDLALIGTKEHRHGYQATHRFARISARKVRPLADLIRGKWADEALDILRYQPQRGARMLEKVHQECAGQRRKTAAGRNIARRLSGGRRAVDGGPMFKRIRPRARGMAHVLRSGCRIFR